ncbi:MAG: HEPN domain-containing protein [Thermoguttaceae bacterium]
MHDNDIVNNWLLKSDEAFQDCQLNIEADALSTAQNRLYYSLFYAVCALAEQSAFRTSKHGQLIGWFNKEFIKSGLVDVALFRTYQKAFEFRQKCDYTFTFKPQKEKLEESLEEVRVFIHKVKGLLK